ncbi:DDE-type integrase/transposase/recombinase (plasmid) [Arthrobacter sp. Z1-9]
MWTSRNRKHPQREDRVHDRVQGESNSRARNLAEGTFLHQAVDDRSRFVYSEILPDETKEALSAFMRNAITAFTARGIKIQRVLTDNSPATAPAPLPLS